MRTALIQDGKVVNVIEVGFNYVPPPDMLAVPTDIAGPGWTYDGDNFVSPVMERDGLFNHARMRNQDVGYIAVDVPAVEGKPAFRAILTAIDQIAVHSIAARAARNPNFAATLQQHTAAGTPPDAITLTGRQFVALDDAIADYYIKHHQAYADVVKAIKDGTIKEYMQVDYPPKHLAQWPLRLKDTTRPARSA